MDNKTTRIDVVVLSILAVSLALNAYLGLVLMPATQQAPPGVALEAGIVVPPMELQTVDGRTHAVSASGDVPVLLYAFTTTCNWCRLNKPNVEALARQAAGRYRFVPICLDCTDATVEIGGVPAFIKPSDNTVLAYKLGSVPMTAVIAPGGNVASVWRGAFVKPELRAEVESALGVKLPVDPTSVVNQ